MVTLSNSQFFTIILGICTNHFVRRPIIAPGSNRCARTLPSLEAESLNAHALVLAAHRPARDCNSFRMQPVAEVDPELCFAVGKSNVRTLAYVPVSNVFVIADHANLNVYSATTGARVQVFDKHELEVVGTIHLCGGVVASMDIGGNIFTWYAVHPTGYTDDRDGHNNTVLDEMRCTVPDEAYATLMKLNESTMLVSIFDDRLLLVSHESGRNLCTRHHVYDTVDEPNGGTNTNSSADGVGRCFVTEYATGQFAIWSKERMEKVGEFRDDCPFYTGAVSDQYIVLDNGKKLIVRMNAPGYPSKAPINIADFAGRNGALPTLEKLTFITPTLLMMTTEWDGIYFYDLGTNERIARVHSANDTRVVNTILMADGRLCVVGEVNGGEEYMACISILHPPSPVRRDIIKCTREIYREKEKKQLVTKMRDDVQTNGDSNVNSEVVALRDELAIIKAQHADSIAAHDDQLKVMKDQLAAVTSAQQNESRAAKLEMERHHIRLTAQKVEMDAMKTQLYQLCTASTENNSNKKRKL